MARKIRFFVTKHTTDKKIRQTDHKKNNSFNKCPCPRTQSLSVTNKLISLL
jgi:hypothetical protein